MRDILAQIVASHVSAIKKDHQKKLTAIASGKIEIIRKVGLHMCGIWR